MSAGPHNEPFASPRNLFPNGKRCVTEFSAELFGRTFFPFPYFAAVDHHVMRVALSIDLDLAKCDQFRFDVLMFLGLCWKTTFDAIRPTVIGPSPVILNLIKRGSDRIRVSQSIRERVFGFTY